MSKLSQLAKTVYCKTKPSTTFERSPHSKNFTEKFPVIIKNLDAYDHLHHQARETERRRANDSRVDIENQIRECGDKQYKKTNVKALMTEWFLQDSSSDFRWICRQAINLANNHNPHKIPMFIFDCWGVIYKEGEYTVMHNHWPHLWSWIYYVNCPKGSAPLVLDKAEKPLRIMPQTGMIIMFPGFVNHSVPAHIGADRVVVAGNISVQLENFQH